MHTHPSYNLFCMRMSLSRRDGLFGDPGADTIHGRGQREHVTQSVVSIIILTYIYYYFVSYQVSIKSIYIFTDQTSGIMWKRTC